MITRPPCMHDGHVANWGKSQYDTGPVGEAACSYDEDSLALGVSPLL